MKTLYRIMTLTSLITLIMITLQAQTRQNQSTLKAKTHLQHNMMLLGQLELEKGIYSTHAGDIVYAFIDGECRGTASPMEQHNGLIFLSIGENTEQPKAIDLMVWLDKRQKLLPISEKFNFAPLKAEGELIAPVILTLGEMVGMDEQADCDWFIGEAYPNPFKQTTVISYTLPEPAKIKVRIYNLMGQLLKETNDFITMAGNHKFLL